MSNKIKFQKHSLQMFMSALLVIAFAGIGIKILTNSKAAAPTTASFTTAPASGSTNVNINSSFVVNVFENSGSQATNGLTAKLSYDATKLTLMSVATTGLPFANNCPTAKGGGTGASSYVLLTCYVTPPGSFTGSKQVAAITFKAIVGTGSTQMSFVNESATVSRIALVNTTGGATENIWDKAPNTATYNLLTPDTTGPALAITAPTANEVIIGSKTITATATDASGISKVEFLVNGTVKCTVTTGTSPYSCVWDSTTITDGTYPVVVNAYDGASPANMSTSTVSVKVQNNKPDLVITSLTTNPAAPNKNDVVTISAVVKNNGSAAIVAGTTKATAFTVDGTALSTVTDTTALAVGASYTVTSTVTWTATLGAHSLAVTADKNSQITESNETNNATTKSVSVFVAGDTGNDSLNQVNLDDLLAVLNNWNKTGQTRANGELSGDAAGLVDLDDLLQILNNWTE